MFQLNRHDIGHLAAAYRANRRVRIANFLTEWSARLLFDHLSARTDWLKVINSGEKLFELDRATSLRCHRHKLRSLTKR